VHQDENIMNILEKPMKEISKGLEEKSFVPMLKGAKHVTIISCQHLNVIKKS
jgi:hypothetical protein